jgi:hypothetical protein
MLPYVETVKNLLAEDESTILLSAIAEAVKEAVPALHGNSEFYKRIEELLTSNISQPVEGLDRMENYFQKLMVTPHQEE